VNGRVAADAGDDDGSTFDVTAAHTEHLLHSYMGSYS